LSAVTRDNSQPWKDVSQCAQSCIERREFVRSVIVDVMAEEFKRGNLERMKVMKDAVAPIPKKYPRVDETLPSELSSRVREELRTFVTERVEQSLFLRPELGSGTAL